MWLCEDKLKGKTAHFWLPSAAQKRRRRVLKFPNILALDAILFKALNMVIAFSFSPF